MIKITRGLHNLKPAQQGCVATIGNFDGVHLGHQAIISRLLIQSEAMQLPAVVLTFDPQPSEYFAKGADIPARLTRFREKVQFLAQAGIQAIVNLPFNVRLENMDAQQFIKTILVERMRVKYLVVGDDFRFGHKREGDFALLVKAGQQYGFEVVDSPSFLYHNERVSSTRIRQALRDNDLNLVASLLGRPYSMEGRVAHGDKRGRIIGFPTANIFLHRAKAPVQGVYAVKFYGVTDQPLFGVANVGTRPTIDGTRSLLEVHLFNFDRNIYGQHVKVEFCHKLREEKRYDSFELLKQQIFKDAENAKAFFGLPSKT